MGFRPEHINLPDASLKSQLPVELKPSLIELTGYEKEVSFEFFETKSPEGFHALLYRTRQAHLTKPRPSEISIFDRTSTLRI
ncbi:MAG: hypothetical protein Ct9H300mP28_25740 [Pseudomonadota bacterium]|nr:MAG: hypothetical protein Ct9H300mP28_25740 [Pseudomonadota bacterium]